MNIEAMRGALEGSLQGKLTFPQVVGMLAGARVESYSADLIRGEEVFYTSDDETHSEKMSLPPVKVSLEFSKRDVMAAIREVQADRIRYPEFLKQAMAAGVAMYKVFITGERVIYIGRKGEFHVEEFPRPK